MLRRLAREGVAWSLFEPVTPLSLARDLVGPGLVERGLVVADEFDELSLIDAAIDEVMAEPDGKLLEPFVVGAGLRAAMAHSVQALRLAGIDDAVLGRAGFRDRQKREALSRVLAGYERRLRGAHHIDTAGVLRLAAEYLRAGTLSLQPARYLILPGQDRRGVSGALLELLIEQGAVVLDDDPVAGLGVPAAVLPPSPDQPATAHSPLACLHAVAMRRDHPTIPVTIDLFAAGSVSDEVREVLRRIVAHGWRWDEVEVVAVDAMAYGAAIDSLARRLNVPVTYAAGLPVARTRPGRAVDAYLRWIRDDFADDILRAVIERGDLAPPAGGHGTSGPALARRLRRMMIGRGRARYAPALERAIQLAGSEREEDDDLEPQERSERADRERRAVADLAAMLRPVLEATPALPDRLSAASAVVSPADLARGLLTFLQLVPATSPIDSSTRDRLAKRLTRLASISLRPTTLEAAIAIVAAKLETRVPAVTAAGLAPWSSAGAHLHVSDVQHGGHTGRRATFIIGLDAVRFPGASPHDTLLGDEERKRLVRGAYSPIPTSGELLEERRWGMARLLSRLRGHVTLSYSAWQAAEARAVAPAAEMLQAFRLQSDRPTADYDALRKALHERASPVPRSGGRLDAADVWLGALAQQGVLLAGTRVVREAFPGLHRGLVAMEARGEDAFGAYHGRITARPALDPRDRPGQTVSVQRLETLGTCPLRYLLRYVLGVTAPERADLDADRWLTPIERGGVLHRVFQRTLEQSRQQECDVADAAFEAIALAALDVQLAHMRERLPPPGDAVYTVESGLLRQDVLAFVQMTRARGAPWVALELRFGESGRVTYGSEPPFPVRLNLPGGRLGIAGRIDRVDRTEDGVVVVDYKTGSAETFGRPQAVFWGGRRLQHVLYALAAKRRFPDDRVVRAEFHFPTHRGETRVRSYGVRELREGGHIVDRLLDLVARGHFTPTDTPEDCRGCDYRTACRVREENGRTVSPLAEWSQRSGAPELHVLRALRRPVL